MLGLSPDSGPTDKNVWAIVQESDDGSNQCICHVAKSEEICSDNVMEHHLNVVIVLFLSEGMIYQATNVVPHSPCEIEPVHIRMLDEWEIAELLPK